MEVSVGNANKRQRQEEEEQHEEGEQRENIKRQKVVRAAKAAWNVAAFLQWWKEEGYKLPTGTYQPPTPQPRRPYKSSEFFQCL